MTFPQDEPKGPANTTRPFEKLFVIFVVLLFGVLIAVGVYSYQINERQTRANTRLRVAAVSRAAEGTIRISRQILNKLVHDYQHHVDDIKSLEFHKRFFTDIAVDFPQFACVWLVDSSGKTVWTTSRDFPPGADQADKPYFYESLKSPGLFIGDPGVFSDGNPRFIISRRVMDPSGRITGVAAITIKSSFLDDINPTSEQGTDNSYALINLEGIILARSPLIPEVIGHKAKSWQLIQSLSGDHGPETFLAERTNKGKRVVSVSKLEGHGLAAVATSVSSDLLNFSYDTVLGVIVPVILCLVFMTIFLFRTVKSLNEIERKRFSAEEGLRESEKRLRLLADNLPNAVVYQILFENNDKRRFTYIGRNIERLSGVTVEAALADVSILYDQVLPEYRSKMAAKEMEALKNLGTFHFEAEARLPDGRTRWFEYCSTPRPQGEGQILWDGVLFDITVRKNAEKALIESERKYRHFVEHAPSGIYEIDWLTGLFIRVNDSMCELLGYSREELLNISPLDLLTESGQDRFNGRRQKSLSGENIHENAEFEIVTRNGRRVWISIHARLVYENGNPVRAQVVAHEITERKHFEELLKHREEHLQAVLESTADGILVVNKDGEITYTNRLFIKMWNVSCEILQGKDAHLLLDVAAEQLADPDGFKAAVEIIYGTPQETLDIFECLDGRIFECFSCPLYEDGLVSGRVWSFRDISERKRAEKELRESEEKYRLLADNVSDNLWILDLATLSFTYISPSVIHLNGYTPEEATGLALHEILTPHSLEMALEVLEEELTKEKDASDLSRSRTLELEQYHKNGSTYWTEVVVQYIRDTDGAVIGLLGVTRNISERKRLEAQLQQAQKMEAVGTLAGGIAHDFNNILQGITGYTQLLLNSRDIGPANRSALNKIEEMALRAVKLVRQMMTFCRKDDVRLEPVNLNQEVLQVVNILERTIPKMIEIEYHLAPDLRIISADSTQIGQIVMNLGANARDAMPQGGRLLIETKNAGPSDLQGSFKLDNTDFVILKVSDTGEGMDQETLNRIFEPFFTTKPVGQGTGLGLSTVYGIVKTHGGYITCDSLKGQGTCFTVFLPVLSNPGALIAHGDRMMEKIKAGSETVLLVDDEEAIVDVAREMLEQYGYTVTTAYSGEEAIKVYRNMGHEIDAVIMDLGMPGMGGHKCMRELLKLNPEAKIIISSGYSVNEEVKDTLESGAAGFIAKPYQLMDLLKMIGQVLTNGPRSV